LLLSWTKKSENQTPRPGFKDGTIVLRPSHTKEPESHRLPASKSSWWTLRVEVEGLRLLDVSEFHHLATEAICEGRIPDCSLLSYAEARLLTIQDPSEMTINYLQKS